MSATELSGELHHDASLHDVVNLLCGMEERLTQRLDGLSAGLEQYSKDVGGNRSSKKQVTINTNTQYVSFPPSPSPTKEALAPAAHTPRSAGMPNRAEPSLTSISNTAVLPAILKDASGSQPQSESVWKRFGKKPSQAAKKMLSDISMKAKRKNSTGLQHRDDSGELRTPSTYDGVTAVLNNSQEHDCGIPTQSFHGWWNPRNADEFAWLASAKKSAESLRQSVYDMLLTKGWLVAETPSRLTVEHSHIFSRTLVRRLVNSPRFEMWCTLLIILNAVLLGCQSEFKANLNNDVDEQLERWQSVFTIWFAIEVFLRIYAWRLNFFLSRHWKWNVFDLIVVMTPTIELLLNFANEEDSQINLGVIRLVRILRTVRAIRFLRVVRFLAELRMMLYSSLRCVKPLFWAMAILYIIIYVFAVIATDIVSDFRRENPNEEFKDLVKFFGSLYWSVYTLFMVVSGGVSWMEPMQELCIVHWSFSIWMSLYVAVVMLAILNIVTGIFLESALKSAQKDQDIIIQEEMCREHGLARGFLEVFEVLDQDKSGYIDAEEFDEHISDSRVRAFLHHLGLDVPEAHSLFRLLDIGGTGKVYAKEFVLGCQQLKGPAKNVDVSTLLFQNKRMMALWAVFMSYVEDQFAVLVEGRSQPKTGNGDFRRDNSMQSPGNRDVRRDNSMQSPGNGHFHRDNSMQMENSEFFGNAIAPDNGMQPESNDSCGKMMI